MGKIITFGWCPVPEIIVGQMVGSYLVDTLGWFGGNKLPFSSTRLAGIVLLIIGVVLVQKK
jgi:transporter family-2 protein